MKTANSAPRHVRCPFCSAAAGQPCRDREGQVLPGLHFQRVRLARSAIAAALSLYAPLGFTRLQQVAPGCIRSRR